LCQIAIVSCADFGTERNTGSEPRKWNGPNVGLPTPLQLGHASPATIHSLVRHHAIEGFELIDDDYPLLTCDSCDYAKTTRKAIQPERTALPTTSFGEEVHSDIWGPSPLTSLGGQRYYDVHRRLLALHLGDTPEEEG
jgi:hypothetical protein